MKLSISEIMSHELLTGEQNELSTTPAAAISTLHASTVSKDLLHQQEYNSGNCTDNTSMIYNITNNSTLTIVNSGDIVVSRPLYEIIIVGLILVLLAIICILGNLLVCVTILSNRKLQSPTNYFILCLSMSDLSLGIFVLPFSMLVTVLPTWPLGPTFCNIYNSSDVMLCTVSILTLFVISLDRYYAVTYPLRYVQRITTRRVFWVCCSIWMFSFIMAFVPIHLGLNTKTGKVQNYGNPTKCQFELNFAYVILVSIGTYFIPLIIMCAVYMKVYYIARKQVKRINQLASLSNHFLENGQHKSDQRMVSESKATFTLASVVTAYAICWIPYFVLFTVKPFLNFTVNVHVDLFVLWLGYVNSLLNPFLYAFHNTEFRYAFMLILCKRWAEKMRDKYTEVTYL